MTDSLTERGDVLFGDRDPGRESIELTHASSDGSVVIFDDHDATARYLWADHAVCRYAVR